MRPTKVRTLKKNTQWGFAAAASCRRFTHRNLDARQLREHTRTEMSAHRQQGAAEFAEPLLRVDTFRLRVGDASKAKSIDKQAPRQL